MTRSTILGLKFCIIALVAIAGFSLPAGRFLITRANTGEELDRKFYRDVPKIVTAISSDPKKAEYVLTMERKSQEASLGVQKDLGHAMYGLSLSLLVIALLIGLALYQTKKTSLERL
jgi:hypothetical protein